MNFPDNIFTLVRDILDGIVMSGMGIVIVGDQVRRGGQTGNFVTSG